MIGTEPIRPIVRRKPCKVQRYVASMLAAVRPTMMDGVRLYPGYQSQRIKFLEDAYSPSDRSGF